MDSVRIVRDFREMCGTFYPLESEPKKRFVLTIDDLDIPIFDDETTQAVYPQIRITPFITDLEIGDYPTYTSHISECCLSDEAEGVEYVDSHIDTIFRLATFQIDIYTYKASEIGKIRDALIKRIKLFEKQEIGTFVEDTWVSNSTYFLNDGYNTSFDILEAYDGSTKLQKIDSSKFIDGTATPGTWALSNGGLYISPITSISNVSFKELINGISFYDRVPMRQKGITHIKMINSHMGYDKDPKVYRWTIEFSLKFKETQEMKIGRSFSGVGVNGSTE